MLDGETTHVQEAFATVQKMANDLRFTNLDNHGAVERVLRAAGWREDLVTNQDVIFLAVKEAKRRRHNGERR